MIIEESFHEEQEDIICDGFTGGMKRILTLCKKSTSRVGTRTWLGMYLHKWLYILTNIHTSLEISECYKTINVYLLWWMNEWIICRRKTWFFPNFDFMSRYFAWDKFVIVSLMKNLLWNIHYCSIAFFFKKLGWPIICLLLFLNSIFKHRNKGI